MLVVVQTRQYDGTQQLPTIVYTPFTEGGVKEQTAIGFESHLCKPKLYVLKITCVFVSQLVIVKLGAVCDGYTR